MGNSSEPKSDKPTHVAGKEDRLAEATSEETLSDLEAVEKGSVSKNSGNDRGPAPDGTPATDHGGERADGSDTGGPM